MKKYRTLLSALFGIFFLVLARPGRVSLLAGLLFILPGESIRIWSSGHIRKNRMLSTTGPYSISRNPLYAGSFLMGLGFVICMGIWWVLAVFLVFFLCVYWFTIRWEEDKLRRIFPGQWEEYSGKVPRIFSPFRLNGYVPGEFAWSQVSGNRELWNASAVLAVYVVLWGKYFLMTGT